MVHFVDSDHFVLIALSVLCLPCYVSVLLSREYRWARPVLMATVMAILTVLTYAFLIYWFPSSFETRLIVIFGSLAGIFCMWRLLLGLGFRMLSDVAVAVIALLVAPVLFMHNSEAIALSLQATAGVVIPSWVGYTILGVCIVAVLLLVRYTRILHITRTLGRILVASVVVFIAIRLAALEGPAPNWPDTELWCFETEHVTRCPLGLEDPVATSALVALILVGIFVFYRHTLCYCCRACRKKKKEQKTKGSYARVKETKEEKEDDEHY